MRTKLRSKLPLLFVVCALLIAIPAVAALADIVMVNDVVTQGEAFKKPGATGTASVYLERSNNDPQGDLNQCNVGSSGDNVKATVTLKSSDINKAFFGPNNAKSDTTTVLLDVCDSQTTSGLQDVNADVTASYTVPNNAPEGTVTINATSVTGGLSGSLYNTNDALTVTIDKTAPAITINTPAANATYDKGASVLADYSCTDGVALDSCSGTVPSGNAIDTATTGTKSFTVNAADKAGNTSTLSRTYTVVDPTPVKQNQTITFGALPNKTYGDADFQVNATGGASDNPVTFAASGDCTIVGANNNMVHLTGAGSCTVTASQAGNTNYKPADSVPQTFTITQADATINVQGYTGVYDGNSHGATGTAKGVNNEDLSNLLNLGNSFTNVPGGTANWTFDGNTNYKSANGTAQIVINKATPTITWNNPAPIDYGTALSATQQNATAKGVDGNSLAGNFAYTPNAGTVLLQGTRDLSVKFTPDSNNYDTASKTVQIVVNPYPFNGFFQPVDNGILNSAKAGSTIPVKFSLGGDKGLNIFLDNKAPTTQKITCDTSTPVDAIEELSTATTSGLKYDPVANQYIYNWKTATSYAGTCQRLTVTLVDGSTAKSALFKFTK